MNNLGKPCQILPGDELLICQRVRLRQQQLIAVAAENLESEAARDALLFKIITVFAAEADDADLDLAVFQHFDCLPRMTLAHYRVEILVGRQRVEIVRRQIKDERRARDADAEPIFYRVARSQRIDALQLADDALGVLQKNRAALGRANALAGPLKNLEAEVRFHLVENTAEVRLADEQIFRCLGNRAGSFYFNQILQMLRIHSISPII